MTTPLFVSPFGLNSYRASGRGFSTSRRRWSSMLAWPAAAEAWFAVNVYGADVAIPSDSSTALRSWPAQLPRPTVMGYGLEPKPSTIRTDMESGYQRVRRITANAPVFVPVTWRLKLDEMEIFEAWHHWKISDGADWFNVDLLNGTGLVAMQARFASDFKARLAGKTIFEVSATLEVRDYPRMSESDLEAALA